jgi:predicted nuclease of predicted toxin-antitoxin system
VKFLLDQGVPARAAALLRESGMSAVHTSEVGLASADDSNILKWCLENETVVVTLDADFHASIALSRRKSPSAVRFRIQGLKGPEVARIVAGLAQAHARELESGVLMTVERKGVRIRQLPVEAPPPK